MSSSASPQRISRARIQTLTKIAVCIALLVISSYLVIPLPFTPVVITAQTLMVNLIALVLTPRQAAAAMGVYLLAGLIGLPVFAGGISGPAKFASPTGGFLIGFFIAVVLISLLKGGKACFWRYLLVTVLVGIPVINLCGTLLMCLLHGMELPAALMSAVVPFLPGDILKAVAACLLGVALNRLLPKAVPAGSRPSQQDPNLSSHL